MRHAPRRIVDLSGASGVVRAAQARAWATEPRAVVLSLRSYAPPSGTRCAIPLFAARNDRARSATPTIGLWGGAGACACCTARPAADLAEKSARGAGGACRRRTPGRTPAGSRPTSLIHFCRSRCLAVAAKVLANAGRRTNTQDLLSIAHQAVSSRTLGWYRRRTGETRASDAFRYRESLGVAVGTWKTCGPKLPHLQTDGSESRRSVLGFQRGAASLTCRPPRLSRRLTRRIGDTIAVIARR